MMISVKMIILRIKRTVTGDKTSNKKKDNKIVTTETMIKKWMQKDGMIMITIIDNRTQVTQRKP